MKKSEKIEIRISYAEKESLSRLAESEGQSVSELIRGLARKYAQLNMPRPNRIISKWHMAGLIMCGIGIGSGAALSLMGTSLGNTKTQYMVHGTIGNNGFGFELENQFKQPQTVSLGQGLGHFEINIEILAGADALSVARFSICKRGAVTCDESARADIEMPEDIGGSVWQTKTKSGESVFLVVQPVTT